MIGIFFGLYAPIVSALASHIHSIDLLIPSRLAVFSSALKDTINDAVLDDTLFLCNKSARNLQ